MKTPKKKTKVYHTLTREKSNAKRTYFKKPEGETDLRYREIRIKLDTFSENKQARTEWIEMLKVLKLKPL